MTSRLDAALVLDAALIDEAGSPSVVETSD